VRELENVCWRMAALAAADTIGVADVDTALNRTRGRRAAPPTPIRAGRRCWPNGHAVSWPKAWKGCTRRCASGSTMPCWRPRCRSPTAAVPKPLPARPWPHTLPALAPGAAGPLNGPCTRSSRPLAEPLIVHGRCRP
jgi:hypothetical protein